MARPSGYTHFTASEKAFLEQWQDEGKTATEVAGLLRRDVSAVARHFKRNSGAVPKAAQPVGRPPSLTDKQVVRVVEATEKMILAADGKYQVTARMVRCALKLKCGDRPILDALHRHGIWFHPMREKPIRTVEDEKERLNFAKAHCDRPAEFWERSVCAYLDNKNFPLYLTGKARAYAAKRAARGTFRKKGEGLARGHVKPRKGAKLNFGGNVMVAVAISASKVLACHPVIGRWNGPQAVEMYSKSLAPALRKAYPTKKRFLLLEDNDPTGYKSNVAKAAKVAAKIDILPFPKRSPDLNPLDYAFWDCVNRRLRRQERWFPQDKKEERTAFVARLRRTIMRVPGHILCPMVKSMKRRCAALKAAKGKDFEE